MKGKQDKNDYVNKGKKKKLYRHGLSFQVKQSLLRKSAVLIPEKLNYTLNGHICPEE